MSDLGFGPWLLEIKLMISSYNSISILKEKIQHFESMFIFQVLSSLVIQQPKNIIKINGKSWNCNEYSELILQLKPTSEYPGINEQNLNNCWVNLTCIYSFKEIIPFLIVKHIQLLFCKQVSLKIFAYFGKELIVKHFFPLNLRNYPRR